MRPYVCPVCGETFIDFDKLEDHVKSNHSADSISCNKSDEGLEVNDGYLKHVDNPHVSKTLNEVKEQLNNLTEKAMEFHAFKDNLMEVLNSLKQTQNEIKQEIFLVRNSQKEVLSHHNNCSSVAKEAPSRIASGSVPRSLNSSRKDVIWFGTSLSQPLDSRKFESEMNTNLKIVEVKDLGNASDMQHSLKETVKRTLENRHLML